MLIQKKKVKKGLILNPKNGFGFGPTLATTTQNTQILLNHLQLSMERLLLYVHFVSLTQKKISFHHFLFHFTICYGNMLMVGVLDTQPQIKSTALGTKFVYNLDSRQNLGLGSIANSAPQVFVLFLHIPQSDLLQNAQETFYEC